MTAELTIVKIFQEIDEAINNSIRDMPVPFKNSNFYKEYKKIKEKYLA